MLHETGTVVALDAVNVTIRVEKRSACGHCSKPCGVDKISKALEGGGNCLELQVKNPGGLQVGQRVLLGLPETALLRATLVVYGLPLVGLMAGAGVGTWLQQQLALSGEGVIMLSALAGAAVAWAIARVLGRRLESNTRLQPVLVGDFQTKDAA